MKGYVILNHDDVLVYRDKEFIDTVAPEFWANNSHLINIVWPIDTDDDNSMHRLFSSLKHRKIENTQVQQLCQMLKYDIQALVERLRKPGANPV